jgi:hypothetical protein
MDTNGTRFHLVLGERDWAASVEAFDDGSLGRFRDLAWDPEDGAVGLKPILSLFRPPRPVPLRVPEDRRGAAADRFGNWYWISRDEHSVTWSPSRGRSRTFWDQAPPDRPPMDGFGPVRTDAPASRRLVGLAVTEHHYLVVGDVTGHGLLVFDLHAGGPPLELRFPEDVAFTPFDLAAAPGGGVWILDRERHAYWGLDRYFRMVTTAGQLQPIEPTDTSSFRPVGGSEVVRPSRSFPRGFGVEAADPISIEGLPDGSVLILDRGATATVSSLVRYRLGDRIGAAVPLAADVRVDIGEDEPLERLEVVAHDIAYVHDAGDDSAVGRLYAADDDGSQVIAFDLAYGPDGPTLAVRVDYLPMHAFGGRAIATSPSARGPDQGVWYDLMPGGRDDDTHARWAPLQALDRPRHARLATLRLRPPGSETSGSGAFDSRIHGCVWHRLFIDGCLPPGVSVTVRSRAADNPEELASTAFVDDPMPYLRPAGAELPFYEPFKGDVQREVPARPGLGTWETLFQAARGRYLEVELRLSGDGRATPWLRAVRVYYPRFSYVQRYLPNVYQDDPVSARFTERLLANPEGFNTELEGRIAFASRLFDPRTAPPDTLDWLAGWVGLLVDPMWARIQARRLVPLVVGDGTAHRHRRHPLAHAAPDRRRLFIRFARKLYERRGTLSGIRFALILLLDPCLEETLDAFRAGATRVDLALRDELRRYGLRYPDPSTREDQLEDLLYDYVLAPGRPSKVRLVEHFQARDGRALAMGDVTPEAEAREDSIAATAHRFSVLVPERLRPEEAAMVERIVLLEKPAHTRFEVHRYYDFFRVGEARLGTDTVVGDGGRFVATVLDDQYLAQGYLASAAPMDTPERVISDRDRPGERSL